MWLFSFFCNELNFIRTQHRKNSLNNDNPFGVLPCGNAIFDIYNKIVSGRSHAGIGVTYLKNLLATMNFPEIHHKKSKEKIGNLVCLWDLCNRISLECTKIRQSTVRTGHKRQSHRNCGHWSINKYYTAKYQSSYHSLSVFTTFGASVTINSVNVKR